MLVISVLLGLMPLGGVAWIAVNGWLATVDGLFTTLILLAMAAVFFINAGLQAKAMGLVPALSKKGQSKAAHGA